MASIKKLDERRYKITVSKLDLRVAWSKASQRELLSQQSTRAADAGIGYFR